MIEDINARQLMRIVDGKSFTDLNFRVESLQFLMSDQPIIIEEGVHSEGVKSNNDSKASQVFFELLDQVQNYDSLTIEIRKRYEQAMLLFAGIKFNNPFALTPNSHRCLPAFLTIKDDEKLLAGYVPFTQQIDEDEYPQEFEQQEEVEKQCKAKTEQMRNCDEQKSKALRQGEPLYRFNVLNQQSEVISASKKFQELLTSLLKLVETKKHIEATFNQMQKSKHEK